MVDRSVYIQFWDSMADPQSSDGPDNPFVVRLAGVDKAIIRLDIKDGVATISDKPFDLRHIRLMMVDI